MLEPMGDLAYSLVLLAAALCLPGVSTATTCSAMQSVADAVTSSPAGLTCSRSVDCKVVTCHNGAQNVTLTLLNCASPPAIKVDVASGTSQYSHTFNQSELVSIPLFGMSTLLNVTITQLPGAIGIQVDVLRPLSITILPYTVIPIDTSDCPGGYTSITPTSPTPTSPTPTRTTPARTTSTSPTSTSPTPTNPTPTSPTPTRTTSTSPTSTSPSPASSPGTCIAMQNITNQLNQEVFPGEDHDVCQLSADCLEIACDVTGAGQPSLLLVMALLPCHTPTPAVSINLDGILSYQHTFNRSEVVAVGYRGIRLNVTVDQLPRALGVQVDVLLPSGEVVHFINYTVIPIDSSSCLAETTCEAMQGITDYLNVETNPDESRDTCTLSKNCLLIACSDNLNWTLVPCSNPPGLTLAWKEGVSNVHTHTFVHTEVVNISNLGQPRTIHVRLDQLQTAIGLQVDEVLDNTGPAEFYPIILYTVIPLECSGGGGGVSVVAVVVPVVAGLLLLLLAVGLLLAAALAYRRYKASQGYSFMRMANVQDEDNEAI